MAGIPQDSRDEPKLSPVKCNTTEILERWKKCMGHMTKIRVCAACGVRCVMTDDECKVLPHTSKLLECCKVKDEKILESLEIDPPHSQRIQAMHIVQIGGKFFKFAKEGVDGTNVTVCSQCETDLFYGGRRNLRSKRSHTTT